MARRGFGAGGIGGAPKKGVAGVLPGVSVEGLEKVAEMCAACEAYGSAVVGAQLRSKQRQDTGAWGGGSESSKAESIFGGAAGGPVSNAEVAAGLMGEGRDFFSATQADVDGAAAAFMVEAERRLAHLASKQSLAAAKIGHALSGRFSLGRGGLSLKQAGYDRTVTEYVGAAWRAALRVWMRGTADRLDGQRLSDGGSPPPVSPWYAEMRQQRFGVPEGIVGKASGQLLANFAAGEDAISLILSAAGAADLRSQTRALARSRRLSRRLGRVGKGLRRGYKGARKGFKTWKKGVKKNYKAWNKNRKTRKRYGF